MKNIDKIFPEDENWIKPVAGFYPNNPFEEYQRIKAVNFSSLKIIHSSNFKQFLYNMMFEKPPQTKVMEEGRVIHEYVFEREKFDERYLQVSEDKIDFILNHEVYGSLFTEEQKQTIRKKGVNYLTSRSTTTGKLFTSFMENTGMSIIDESLKKTCYYINENIYKNKLLNKMMTTEGYSECTVVWIDEYTGIPCKARVDRYANSIVNDLKTSSNISPKKFRYSIKDYYYHMQQSMYATGLIANGHEVRECWIWAAEKTGLKTVLPYRLKKNSLEFIVGYDLFRSALGQIVDYIDNDIATGYVDTDSSNKFAEFIINVSIPFIDKHEFYDKDLKEILEK